MKKELKNEQGFVYYIAEYWKEEHWVYTAFFGDYISVEQVQAGALTTLEFIKEYKVTKLLNDNRELTGVWDEANEWIANYWIPEAISLGLKQFAHILSKDLFCLLSGEFMENNAKQKAPSDQFRLVTFESQEEAEKWLSEG